MSRIATWQAFRKVLSMSVIHEQCEKYTLLLSLLDLLTLTFSTDSEADFSLEALKMNRTFQLFHLVSPGRKLTLRGLKCFDTKPPESNKLMTLHQT